MPDSFFIIICAFFSNLLRAAWRALVSEPAGPYVVPGLSLDVVMQGLSLKEFRQLKQEFLEAIRDNNAGEVLHILLTSKLDVDTVLEVDDPSMVLASYKQGNG